MESLAAVALAVVVCSLPQTVSSWVHVLLSAGALACIGGVFLMESLSPTATTLASSWLVAPKQTLSFSALFLGSLASRAGASENVSQLALTTLFWQLSIPKHDRKGMLALVSSLQCAQTALVCGAHVLLCPPGASTYTFIISAILVGIIVPASWLLPGVLWSVQTPGGPAAAAAPPGNAVVAEEALRHASGSRDDSEHYSCAPAGLGPPIRCHTSCHPIAASARAAATAATSALAGRDARHPSQPGTGLNRSHSLDPPGRPRECAEPRSPWATPTRELLPGLDGHGELFSGRDGHSVITPPPAVACPPTATTTIACQTDDELLLWLFAGRSTAPSAVDEVRDDPRASFSGILSPKYKTTQAVEPWGSATKHGSATAVAASRSGGGGYRGSGESSSGGDGRGRSGGVGKYDSFTSVWSRCTAGGGYGKGASSMDALDLYPPVRALEEGRLSSGSQQGSKDGGQQAAGLPSHAHPSPKHQQSGSGAAGGVGSLLLPAVAPALQQQPRATADGGGGAASPPGPPGMGYNSAPPHLHQPYTRSSPRSHSTSASGRSCSGTFGGAGADHSAAPAAAAAAAAALGVTAAAAVARPGGLPADRQGPPVAAGSAAAAGRGSGCGSGSGSVSVASRSLARRQRLQRSRTFNVLSPERSRVLMELATKDGGTPVQLPPAELDEQLLGVLPVSVPSPYSEDSEDEIVQKLRALRALRRFHPDLAISLDRFTTLQQGRHMEDGDGAAAAAVPGGAATGMQAAGTGPAAITAAAAAPRADALPPLGGVGRGTDAGAAGLGRITGELVARPGGRRAVRRTQSFTCATRGQVGGGAEAEEAQAPQHEPPLLRSLFMMQHQQRQQPAEQARAQVQVQAGGVAFAVARFLPEVEGLKRTGMEPLELMAAEAAPQLVDDVGELLPPLALSAANVAAVAAGAAASGDGGGAAASSVVAADARSELSFGNQLLLSPTASGGLSAAVVAGSAAAYGNSTTSSRRWSCASSSSASAGTVGSRGERLIMSAMEPTYGSYLSDVRRPSVEAAGGGGGAAVTIAVAYTDSGRRAHQVQRSRSAGESGFWSGGPSLAGGRHHWSQLPHQEHRRASLMQAWHVMMAEAGLLRVAATGSAAAPAPGPTPAVPPATHSLDSDGALPYGTDPHDSTAAAAGTAGSAGHSPPGAAGVGGGRPVSGDGSGPSAARTARSPGAAADERSVRLCKSLSERSLQQRLASSHHYRRVGRTKSRFALLQQQDPSDGSAGGASSLAGTSLPRISSGDSMGCRTLENVLEEQEEDEEEGLLAAAAGAARVSVTGRHSASGVLLNSPSPAASVRVVSQRLRASDSGCTDGGGSRGSGSGSAADADAAADAAFDAAFAAAAAEGAAAAAAAGRLIGRDSRSGGLDAAADAASAAAVGGSGSPRRRVAWRSASELSFASGRMCSSRPGTGFGAAFREPSGSGSGGGGVSPRRSPGGGGGSRSDRRSMDSADLGRGTVTSWMYEGDENLLGSLEASVVSVDGPAGLSPSLLGGSNGSRAGGDTARPSLSGAVTVDSLIGLQRNADQLSLARGSGVAMGGGGGSRAGGGGVGEGSDSDQELLDVLADEAVLPSGFRRRPGDPLLRRLREQGMAAPGKTASFRFAAPIVPPVVPPSVPPPPAAVAAVPGIASPVIAVAGGQSPPDSASEPAAALPPAAVGAGSGPHSGANVSSPDDHIPLPTLEDPVLPELDRERERARDGASGSPPASGSPSASGSPQAAAGPPAAEVAAAAASSSAAAAAASAPLSAQNLHHHTRHWEATSPDASDPAALALQLPSPSPSQSGPIDPLSDGESAPSAALLAVLNMTVAAAATGASGAVGGGGAASGGDSPQPSSPSQEAASSGAAGGGSGPVPRAVLVARLSMPLLPYNNPEATALVAAAGRHAAAAASPSVLSRHASNNTLTALSICDSAGSLIDAAASAATLLPPPAGDDVTPAAAAAAASATASATPSHHTHHSSVISRSPSVLVGPSMMVRINSGGGGGPFSGSGATFNPRQTVAPSTVRPPSKLAGGAAMSGGEAVEQEVEEAVMANRRVQDDRGVLLEEINIDKVLGFGSMGMVYYGRLYDTKVVVKLIEHGTGVLGKEKERGRLARVEACVSRMLLHPNIVLTYDACTGSLQPGSLAAKLGRGGGMAGRGGGGMGGRGGRQRFMTVMVQEFCELGTLKDALSKRRHGLAAWCGSSSPSSPQEGLPLLYRVALDVANGMKHLAALRIIHADLKAENVLLQKGDVSSDRPHGFTAKVADFGLAMVLSPGDDEIRQGIHGTVSHMPPEAMKDTCFSLATDVFSFGVVLWELYTTESPYRGMAPHEVVEAVCVRGDRPLWPESSPTELVTLAEDCWHADPHQRPSFTDVVERLRQLLAPTHGPPERSGSLQSGMTEESDELEMALRQQRRGKAPAPLVRGGGGGGGAVSETGSELGGASGRQDRGGMPTRNSSRACGGGGGGDEDEGEAGVPRAAPRDPLGLLLWALCQFPGDAPLRVAGPLEDSEQWVLPVEDMVLRSRREHEEAEGSQA